MYNVLYPLLRSTLESDDVISPGHFYLLIIGGLLKISEIFIVDVQQ